MAEHPHAQLVRKGYEAFQRGDMDTLRGLLAADCTQHVPGSHPLSGDYKGQDAIIDMYGRLFEETGGSMSAELLNLLVDGRGHVVSLHRFSAERQGHRSRRVRRGHRQGQRLLVVTPHSRDPAFPRPGVPEIRHTQDPGMPKAPAPTLGKGRFRGLRIKAVEPVPAWRTQAAYGLLVPGGSGERGPARVRPASQSSVSP
jgi:ketosteroid isomerase-like protein